MTLPVCGSVTLEQYCTVWVVQVKNVLEQEPVDSTLERVSLVGLRCS